MAGSASLAAVVVDVLVEEDENLRDRPRVEWKSRQWPSLGGIALVSKLGEGGMGAVYRGRHLRLETDVAVKVLSKEKARKEPELAARFLREARLAAQVKSPYLVAVTDVNTEEGLSYMVMELVQGQSAGTCVRQLWEGGKRSLPEAEALEVCIAATTGLHAAHSHSQSHPGQPDIIHRDVKPDNILVPYRKTARRAPRELEFSAAKLADLGLARPLDQEQGLTISGYGMGTPGFMAPEQADDATKAGKPADVFSMGATLFFLLAGQRPFAGKTTLEVIRATKEDPPVELKTLRRDVSDTTRHIIAQCLEKDPTKRFANAGALLEALRQCRTGDSVVPPSPLPNRRRWFWPAVAAMAVVVIVGAVWLAARGRRGAEKAPTGTTPTQENTPVSQQRMPVTGAVKAPQVPSTTADTGPLGVYLHGFGFRYRGEKREEFALNDGMTLYHGDQYKLAFSPTADCYVYVLNVDSQSNYSLLLPRAGQGPAACRAQAFQVLPDGRNWFTLDQNAGQESFYFVASRKPLAEFGPLLANAPKPTLAELAGLVKGLDQAVDQTRRAEAGEFVALRGITIEAEQRPLRVELPAGGATLAAQPALHGSDGNVVVRWRFAHKALYWILQK